MRRASARPAFRAGLRNVGGCHSETEECHRSDADPGRVGVLGGRRSAQGVTRAGVAVMVTAVVLVFAGCATSVLGAPTVDSSQVSMYRSEQSASTSAARRGLAATLCRQAMSSMVVMVRGYNTFVARLNAVQSYDRVGDLDDRARASLIAGVDQIRAKVTDAVSADVTGPVNAFLTSSGRLGDAIGRRELVGLNPISDTWTRDKQSVLAACATYLPTPPGLASTPAGAAPPG
ncbi:hypothetical protein QNM97_08190 [Gordonia sp. L191]|uniref:hypothetical protein n=1 Tax=Gordonia sp. L191 TaxID=2982699 RepID=UPI0024BF17E6|nr:hypothetical protein [Gordonia sp. L191]WHU48942.1 hypothetical protein QNM97_08190 [Gordonia sp. L191]